MLRLQKKHVILVHINLNQALMAVENIFQIIVLLMLQKSFEQAKLMTGNQKKEITILIFENPIAKMQLKYIIHYAVKKAGKLRLHSTGSLMQMKNPNWKPNLQISTSRKVI